MPSDAFIKAASAANRQPVVLLAIESIDAIKKYYGIQSEWQAGQLDNINTTYEPGNIRLTTNDVEPISGPAPSPTVLSGISSPTAEVVGDNPFEVEAITPVFYTHPLTASKAVSIQVWCTDTTIKDESRPDLFSRKWILYGKSDNKDWRILTSIDLSVADTSKELRYDNLSSDTGWSFKVKIIASQAYTSLYPLITVGYYQITHETHYLPAGSVTTTPIDLGVIPSIPSQFAVTGSVNTGCSIIYSAWGKNSEESVWTSLGSVVDGGALAPFRYYQIRADLTSSNDGLHTPIISQFTIIGGDSQYTNLSTHKDTPMQGALPYIVPGGISSISSKIDLTQQATVGELTAKLYWRKEIGGMLVGDWIKNKTIICKLGFVGLSEAEYEPYFVGTWYDYQSDQEKGIITVKTRNILKRFNKKVPEAEQFLTLGGDGIYTPKAAPYNIYTLSGNIMDVMRGICSGELGIPTRLLNLDSFTSIGMGARSGPDWDVHRDLTEPVDAMEMLNELSVSSGVFLFEGADGRLTAKLYDEFAAAPPVATLDAVHCKFRPVDGGQKDLSTRQAIYYQLLPGATGSSTTDYALCHYLINQTAEIAWDETNTREWLDKWALQPVPIQLLAQRWQSWFSVPRAKVRVDGVPPRYHGIERGDIVAVNNLQLPCAKEDWQGYTDGTRFLVMGKSISDPSRDDLTLSFDLMQLEEPVFVTDPDFPDYSRLDYWPAVRELTATERFDDSNGVVNGYLDVSFKDPAEYNKGYAVVWTSTNGGEWVSHTVIPFGLVETIKRLSIPVNPGDTVEIKVTTVRPDDRQMPIEDAPAIVVDVTVPAADPSNLLKILNYDITEDKLAQYLLKKISLAELTETVNHAVEPGAFEEGAAGTLPELLYANAKQLVLIAGEVGKQSTQIELLNDRISLKLNSNGHVAGMAIGWNESGEVSETVFLNDIFKVVLPTGGDPITAFTTQLVNEVPTLGLNGDLIVAGSITADKLFVGEIDDPQGITSIIGGVITTDYVNALNITAASVEVETLSGISAMLGEVTAGSIIHSDNYSSNDRIDWGFNSGESGDSSSPFYAVAAAVGHTLVHRTGIVAMPQDGGALTNDKAVVKPTILDVDYGWRTVLTPVGLWFADSLLSLAQIKSITPQYGVAGMFIRPSDTDDLIYAAPSGVWKKITMTNA
ncbi:MAG: hypothetical protein PHU01_01675 [Desulfuromonadaceae bacterium]|nr:hypothetical protein [Desulfuromonadaceae bacterium]